MPAETSADPFGYDSAGRPVAVKLTSNVYAFGAEFCETLQALMRHACRPVTRLAADNEGMIFMYHPQTRRAGLWVGFWQEDEPGTYSILDPKPRGVLARTFYDFDDLWVFADSSRNELKVIPGRLEIAE